MATQACSCPPAAAEHLLSHRDFHQQLAEVCARREGWPVKLCRRGDRFGVIEFWVEGCQMVEVLTPEMQREYLDTITIENWNRMLEAGPRSPVLADAA